MSQVAVQLVCRKSGKFNIRVALNSDVKPTVWSETFLDADIRNPEHACAVAGEALAAYQCEHLGDRHDPRAVGMAAEKGMRRLQSMGLEANRQLERRN